MNPLDPSLLLMSIVITGILFVAIAFFSRAGRRRIAGALVGAIPVIFLVMLYDEIAGRLGWWYYPAVGDSSAPIAWYISAALFYGAGLGLVGWRVIRRFGRPGFFLFVAIFALFGVSRDLFYASTAQLIQFGGGILPILGDGFAYASCALVVQGIMYWMTGSPRSDTLARMTLK